MKNIAVFFGGQSVEHEISILTGVMAVNSLDTSLYNPIPVYVAKDGKFYTGEKLFDVDEFKKLNVKGLKQVVLLFGDKTLYWLKKNRLKKIADISCAINCMHGERGEDGSLAGLLNMCAIPLASPPITPSATCIDKEFTKTVMKGLKVKTLPGVAVCDLDEVDGVLGKLKFPLIVKPNNLGSSIGVERANDKEQLKKAVLNALKFGNLALIEPCLENFIEINCACYRDKDGAVKVSECERPIGSHEVLTFTDKYECGKRVFPADIEQKFSNKIKETTRKIYNALKFSGVIRIDYFISDGEVYLNEINTVPGSLAYYLFSDTLKGFKSMLTELITFSEREFAKGQTVQKTFKSGILMGIGSKGSKHL